MTLSETIKAKYESIIKGFISNKAIIKKHAVANKWDFDQIWNEAEKQTYNRENEFRKLGVHYKYELGSEG